MTFSLVGHCSRTGMLGVAVTSSSPAVAARCARVRERVGACASQNLTDPRLGARLLDLLAAGRSAEQAVAEVVAGEPTIAYRQLVLVDRGGGTAVFTGALAIGRTASAQGEGVAAAGNTLARDEVVSEMVRAFEENADAHLGDRLVAALQAGLEAGGEEGPVRSCGLLLAGEVPWPVADLRVDWHDQPLEELGRLWAMWKPQLQDYVTRALDPASAPGFGVPGDVGKA